MPSEFSIYIYLFLFLVSCFAGFVDSIAGGGGLITMPALLSVGIPPHLALGTNKLQSSFGSFTSSLRYSRYGLVDLKETLVGVFFTALGATLGTLAVQHISAVFLSHLILVMLVILFFYTLFTPKFGVHNNLHRIPHLLFYLIFGLLIGFYDGFFGPGTGSFWTIAFVVILGLNLKAATAHTKVMNFTSNIVSLAVFAWHAQVLFIVGLLMGIGQVLGAMLGTHLVIRKEVRFIRIFFLGVVAATLLKIIYDNYFS